MDPPYNAIHDMTSQRERLRRLAWLLDSSIGVPGTRFTFGLDALLGLIPFAGDALGVVLSGYILLQAARLGAPRPLLWRMAANVAVEGLVGAVPLAGDLFDAAWKANQKNVRLLEEHLDRPVRSAAASRRWVMLIAAVLIALAAGALWLAYLVLHWLWQVLSG
jgi:hypothetical protein